MIPMDAALATKHHGLVAENPYLTSFFQRASPGSGPCALQHSVILDLTRADGITALDQC